MSASRQERDTDSRIARQARGVKAPSPVGFAGALHMVVVSRCIQADEWSLLSLLWFNVLVSSAATMKCFQARVGKFCEMRVLISVLLLVGVRATAAVGDDAQLISVPPVVVGASKAVTNNMTAGAAFYRLEN